MDRTDYKSLYLQEKARADAAEAEHRFSLRLVDSAQATIASLTAKLEEARGAVAYTNAASLQLLKDPHNWHKATLAPSGGGAFNIPLYMHPAPHQE